MSVAEANRNYFDTIADIYSNKPWYKVVNQKLTNTLRSRLDWVGIPFATGDHNSDGKEVRLLDYACGPGVMARVFGPYVTVTRGVDVSPNMVASFNAQAQAANFPPSQINAVVGDMFSKDSVPAQLAGPEYYNFDLAVAGFAFHHFEDVVLAARRLKERLRPGGVLLITDFLEGGDLKADENGNPIEGSEGNHSDHIFHGHGQHEDSNDHGHHHHHHQEQHKSAEGDDTAKIRKQIADSIVIPHFTLEGVRQFFTEAGFVDVDVVAMDERVYMEFAGRKVWRTILYAKGRRPLEEQVPEKSEL